MKQPGWLEAASFAARAHRHQLRKDGRTPYVAHVFRVALTVRDLFECDDAVALTAALLHDTVEDTTTDYDEIEERFGEAVAECVAALTKNMAMPERMREAEYDRRLAGADWRARLIKLADVHDNLIECAAQPADFVARTIDRARRAVEMARGDAARHPAMERAIRIVERLVEERVV